MTIVRPLYNGDKTVMKPRNESASDYLERKAHIRDRMAFKRRHESLKFRKQFWHEFAKTHRGLEA